MNKDINEAKKRYKEAISLARAVGFDDGIENSSAALRRIS
jgi:2,4-dienoyl-CoA reductase-like NADH-dependent reductase (Old Yellow Enzyme family)